jgi:hypothetical protein
LLTARIRVIAAMTVPIVRKLLVSCRWRLTVSVAAAKSMSHQRSPAASPRRSPVTAISW